MSATSVASTSHRGYPTPEFRMPVPRSSPILRFNSAYRRCAHRSRGGAARGTGLRQVSVGGSGSDDATGAGTSRKRRSGSIRPIGECARRPRARSRRSPSGPASSSSSSTPRTSTSSSSIVEPAHGSTIHAAPPVARRCAILARDRRSAPTHPGCARWHGIDGARTGRPRRDGAAGRTGAPAETRTRAAMPWSEGATAPSSLGSCATAPSSSTSDIAPRPGTTQPLDLTRLQFRLLVALATAEGSLVSRRGSAPRAVRHRADRRR